MAKSSIEWLARKGTKPESWNPLRDTRVGESGRGYHCTKCSPGCLNCWAEVMNDRFGNGLPYDNAGVSFALHALAAPLHWRKRRTVFVQSMSDLFHELVSLEMVTAIWDVMTKARKHTFLTLTKRAWTQHRFLDEYLDNYIPPPHIWNGVSCEDNANRGRIVDLCRTPSSLRFVSAEPLIGPLDLRYIPYYGDTKYYLDVLRGRYSESEHSSERGTPFCFGLASFHPLGWVIIGGESGPHARPMDLAWAISLVNQCRAARVPVFVKQLGTYWASRTVTLPNRRTPYQMGDHRGSKMEYWPAELQVREWPRGR